MSVVSQQLDGSHWSLCNYTAGKLLVLVLSVPERLYILHKFTLLSQQAGLPQTPLSLAPAQETNRRWWLSP